MPISREEILEGLKRGETMILQESFPEFAIVKELEAKGLVTLTPGPDGIEVNWNGNNDQDREQSSAAPDRSKAVLSDSDPGSAPV